MLTKGAIGNLINRYKAVLKKCNLINTFGSLAVASMLVLGGAGVAMAKDFLGAPTSITTEHSGDKLIAGWHSNDNTVASTESTTTSLTVNSTNTYGDVVGGNYLKNNTTQNSIFNLGTTNITIEKINASEGVIGGSKFSVGWGSISTKETNLTIKDGTIGNGISKNYDKQVLTGWVVGGDVVKNDTGFGNDTYDAQSTVGTANINISGGTFDSLILGGSAVQDWYENAGGYNDNISGAYQYAHVNTVNINITGGTFKHNIYAGGYAMAWNGEKSISSVGTANVIIDGANTSFAADIYAGGLEEYRTGVIKGDEKPHGVSVSTANITLNNVNAENTNIYCYSGTHRFDGNVHNFEMNSNKPVNTNLLVVNSSLKGINIAKGSVNLRVENNGTVKIDSFAAGEAVVTMSADSATNDAVGGAAGTQELLDTNFQIEASAKNGSFTMDAGAITGKVTGTVENGIAHVTEAPNETNVAMADLPLINHMLTRVEMNDLRKRMGDIRLLEGETGTWARWEGGRLKGDNGLTNDFHKIQLGADTTTGIESLRLGASFSYTNGDMDFAKASAESDTLSFAGYGVWTADNGMFADVIARLAFIDTEIQTDKVKGELDNLAFSLSGEYGWRFNLCDQFFVEPQVELTYTYIDSDDFTSAGAKFDFDSSDSLIGRAGLAAGWKLPDDRGDLYARASVVQEFMGDGKLTASMGNTLRRYETDGDDTWFEYGIGTNIKLTNKTYIWADVERTEGADVEEEWRGTVGIRYSF